MSIDGDGGPLSGYRILDLTANMTGPYATMILADQGAEVVKVEPPGGEIIRRVGPGRGGLSAYFANLNRSKRSIVIDLQRETGQDLCRRLAGEADVLVQNFRPGVIERLGLGPDRLLAELPSLVYVSISGFGATGPMASMPAYDHVVQALSGMAARQADGKGGPPTLVRHGVVDKVTGLFAAEATVAALLRRHRTGRGGHVEVAMLDAALHFLWPDGMMKHTCVDNVEPVPDVSGSFRLTETADGHVAIITVTDRQWFGLIAAARLEHLATSPDLQTVQGRMVHGGRAMREVAAVLSGLTTEETIARLRANDVPCGPVSNLADLANDEQIDAVGALLDLDHPILGRIKQPRSTAQFLGDDPWLPDPAPAPGADTDDVLDSLGITADEVAALRASGVVA